MQPRLVSVNTGTVREDPRTGRRTAIDKRPVSGQVRVGELGLSGDEVADTADHGGPFQAVYAFAQEDLDAWTERLGAAVRPGLFGENLTTAGIDVNASLLGETWRVGTALLEVVSVRIPCSTFKDRLGAEGFDETGWVKRFTAEARPGPYLRVLEPGTVSAGDPIAVEHRPDHDVSVSLLFRALTTDRPLLERVARMPGLDRLDPEARDRAERYVAPLAGGSPRAAG